MIGRVVGKYKILEQIGEGGMGVVYRAEHTVLGSPAAVKVLLPQFTRDSVVVDRFFTEAKATSTLNHPGIVQVFDYGRLANDQAFIAMELLRGEDLTSFLGRQRIDPAVVVQIGMQLLSALEKAHVMGVIHRDIKPDNIYLVRDPMAPGAIRIKILDFGIAKLMGDRGASKQKTKGGAILGTPAYMAPEQCKGGVEIDARADLYAVGCILFELLTSRAPFVAEGDGELMAKHIYEQPPRLRDLAPQLPPELDTLIAKMLAKAPAERVPSAASALAALERVPLDVITGEVPLLGTRAIASSSKANIETVSLDDFRHEPIPKWIPIAVIVGALVLASIAVVVIGFL
ncbi:MAG: serine/threonine-protein kinase [Kofleriaceae bacterium]